MNVIDKKKCSGCSACKQICPMNCIKMKPDDEGFLYPEIDVERCISCNQCRDVCPIRKHQNDMRTGILKAYGGWHKDSNIRADSSSGGAFSLLAIDTIQKGGVVFGCTLDVDMKALHIGVDSINDLALLRGSKYVQSDINDVYMQIRNFIHQGRQVLFVGTPCQAAGLYNFMGKHNYPNLCIVDFICHGVPSPMIFHDYVLHEEQKKNSRITMFRFRNKDKGWNASGLQLGTYCEYENGEVFRKYPAFKDKYMNAFLDDVCLRPTCYDCNFKELPKEYADFTIADFWGVNKINSKLDDKKGTSLIIVHSEKGEKLWSDVCVDFEYEAVDLFKAIKRNTPLLESARYYPRRDKFFEDYNKKGYEYVEKKYMSAGVWGWHKILSIVRRLFCKLDQFIKFGIVGISNTFISLAVYYVGILLGIHYMFAYTLGFIASVCNAFYWNNKYVFKDKQESNILKAFFKAFISYGISFLLSIVLVSIMVEFLHISEVVAPILKLTVTIPLNFILNKLWAFKDKRVSNM